MRLFLVLLISITALHASAMESNNFGRMNYSEKSYELALDVYEKDSREVHLMGTIHMANEAYYEAIRELVKEFDIIVYEMLGCDYQQKLSRNAALQRLSEEYRTQYDNLRIAKNPTELSAQVFGLTSQSKFDYFSDVSKAQMLIHADFPDTSDDTRHYASTELLTKHIDDCTKRYENQISPRSIDAIITEKRSKLTSLKTILENSLISKQTNQDREREDLVINCLKNLFKDPNKNKKILVLYGAFHQPRFADFLQIEGFIKRKRTWITVLNW